MFGYGFIDKKKEKNFLYEYEQIVIKVGHTKLSQLEGHVTH